MTPDVSLTTYVCLFLSCTCCTAFLLLCFCCAYDNLALKSEHTLHLALLHCLFMFTFYWDSNIQTSLFLIFFLSVQKYTLYTSPHLLRTKACGHPLVISTFYENTSGNRSKKWNKSDSSLVSSQVAKEERGEERNGDGEIRIVKYSSMKTKNQLISTWSHAQIMIPCSTWQNPLLLSLKNWKRVLSVMMQCFSALFFCRHQ